LSRWALPPFENAGAQLRCRGRSSGPGGRTGVQPALQRLHRARGLKRREVIMCSTRVTEQPGWWGGGPVILRFAGFIAATLTLVACGEVQAPAVYEPTTDPKRLFM